METPWGGMDPNSAHQLWSEWTFTIQTCGPWPPLKELRENALRWLRIGFGSVGRARIERQFGGRYTIVCQVEGVPAHDPGYVANVRLQFQKNFVEKGWGPLAVGSVEVRILAGDVHDGRPPAQLVVIPPMTLEE